MCKISDSSRQNSRESCISKTGSSREFSEGYNIINKANSRIKLLDVLRHYRIKIVKNHQRSDWSYNITCPFPSHKKGKETDASFGYCFPTDRFYCFGCQSSGRAVEFISLYEQISKIIVAERILSQYSSDDFCANGADDYSQSSDNLTPVLLEGSVFLQKLIQKNKDKPEVLNQIDKLIWWLDFYLAAKISSKTIDKKELQYRINRMKELLTDEVFDIG